jgi:hypothetical protein
MSKDSEACALHKRKRFALPTSNPRIGVSSAELHVVAYFRPRDFPRIAVTQPLVGDLDLPSVLDALVEDAEFIADAVTDRRYLHGRKRFHVARRKPAQAPVAEARLFLLFEELVEIEAQIFHRPSHRFRDAEIQEVRAEMRAEQEFEGQIAHRARSLVPESLGAPDPAREQPVAHRISQRLVIIVAGSDRREACLYAEEVVAEGAFDRVDAPAGPHGIERRSGYVQFSHRHR